MTIIITFFCGCIIMKKATTTPIAFFNGFVAKNAMATFVIFGLGPKFEIKQAFWPPTPLYPPNMV
jgi:hypothetical protein